MRSAHANRVILGRGLFISTSSRFGLKESSTPETDFDKHKQDSLAKQKKGTGHWKPELASDSEEAVKADRLAGDLSAKELQERTKRAAEETAKAGTSMKDNM
ncbi:hypothetical protein CDV31_015312 [Fusarium ambrosium]|uniref:Mitochondrial carrier protein pet8 n=1 Tax=Fusarium ambrosium TaxID=131363 RepID=A0A428SQM5_9HYPO|nr:hypothetical protein CDV31_015312 [Fusarium ambrosium]